MSAERFPIMHALLDGHSDFFVTAANFLGSKSPVPLFDRGADEVDDFDRTLVETTHAEVEPNVEAWERFEGKHPDRAGTFIADLAAEMHDLAGLVGVTVTDEEARAAADVAARGSWAASVYAAEDDSERGDD